MLITHPKCCDSVRRPLPLDACGFRRRSAENFRPGLQGRARYPEAIASQACVGRNGAKKTVGQSYFFLDFLAGLLVVLVFEAKDFFEDLPFFVLSDFEVPPLGGGAPTLGDGVKTAGASFTFRVTLPLAVV